MQASDPFAILVPLSPSAAAALSLSRNRCRLDKAVNYMDVLASHHVATREHATQLVAKMDFAMIHGRRSISFGKCRAARFLLPAVEGVSGLHFHLHFDLSTADLLLTDTSERGTLVDREHLVHRATHRISQGSLELRMGDHYDMVFLLVFTEFFHCIAPAQTIFAQYVGSLTRCWSRSTDKDQLGERDDRGQLCDPNHNSGDIDRKRRRSPVSSDLGFAKKRRRSSQLLACF